MKQILFVQGAGKDVHDQWDDKLVASLERALGADYAIRYPRMPGEEHPRYAVWKEALFREFDALDEGAILVGHSVGGTMLIHALGERRPTRRLGAIFLLAAPFIGEGGWPSDDATMRADFSERLPAGVPVFLHHGAEDEIVPTGHVELYAKAIPHAVVRILEGRNHQLDDDLGEVARDIRSLG